MKFWYITAKENKELNLHNLDNSRTKECPKLFGMILQVVRQVDILYCRDSVLSINDMEFVNKYPQMPIMPKTYKFEKYMRFFHKDFFCLTARKSKMQSVFDSLPEYMQECLTLKYMDL